MSENNTMIHLSQNSNARFVVTGDGIRIDNTEHVFVTGRDPNCAEMKELERSAIVNIERCPENYICIHNVLQVITTNMDIKSSALKWKPYNDNKFLIVFETKSGRDEFVSNNALLFHGDTAIRFAAFDLTEGSRIKTLKFKVWVVIKGLPVQHLCYKTAELIASRFGRLYACDIGRKATYVGSFRIMVVCNDITKILENMVFHFENDGETDIQLKKEYVCTVQDYNSMDFNESEMNFEEVLYALLEAKKLTPLS